MRANKVTDKGAHDHDSDVATTADHRELAFDLEICRQPCEERIVAALGAGGEQTSQDRGPDELRREYFERPLSEASGGDLFPGGLEHRRILNEAPQKKDNECWGQANPEQSPPSDILRKRSEKQSREYCSYGPTDGPSTLDEADSFATMPSTDNLTHQYSARGPFAAEAEPH